MGALFQEREERSRKDIIFIFLQLHQRAFRWNRLGHEVWLIFQRQSGKFVKGAYIVRSWLNKGDPTQSGLMFSRDVCLMTLWNVERDVSLTSPCALCKLELVPCSKNLKGSL